jgi:hypothetical protein
MLEARSGYGGIMTLSKKQLGVLSGMAIGMLVTAAIVIAGASVELVAPLSPDDLAGRLHFGGALALLPVGCLVLAIARLAHHRFVTPEDIDGGGMTGGTPRARLLQAELQNTVEQTVLAVPIYLGWSVLMLSRLVSTDARGGTVGRGTRGNHLRDRALAVLCRLSRKCSDAGTGIRAHLLPFGRNVGTAGLAVGDRLTAQSHRRQPRGGRVDDSSTGALRVIGVSGSISFVRAGSTRTPCGTGGPGTARVVRAGFFAARPCSSS